MKLRLGGAWQDITGAKVFSGGAWRTVTAIKVYEDAAWRDVANFTGGGGTITLAISPSPVTKTGRTATITTSNVTATPAGGLAPYAYAWVKQSGDDIGITAPSSAVTKFHADGMSVDEVRTAVFRCTCTDALTTTDSEDATVQITCLPPSEGGPENPDQ
jgi:hypothetical protein